MKRLTLIPHTRWWLLLLGLSLIGGLIVQGLNLTTLKTTALMYWGLPWLVAVVLTLTAPRRTRKDGQTERKVSVMRGSLIVMLGSSFLIGEGFICVLMFLPIYLVVAGMVVVFTDSAAKRSPADSKQNLIHLSPLLLGLFALEGTHPNLSFERQGVIAVSQTTSLTRQQLWANVRQPMILNRAASGGLSRLFPQPVKIDIDSFEPGSVHRVHYRYARWLWTNVHEGSLELRVDESTNDTISAQIINNSSYLANYLEIERITLRIIEQPDRCSDVTIRIEYRRTLDPAWYFSPLIKLALKGTAAHLINTHVLREG